MITVTELEEFINKYSEVFLKERQITSREACLEIVKYLKSPNTAKQPKTK